MTAPAGTRTEILREVLRDRNVITIAPEGLRAGASWAEQLREVLARADFVIGVLPTTPLSPSVIFDLGHASALGKRIVLFAAPSSERLPVTMTDILTIRADLDNRDALGFAIDQLLSAPAMAKHGTERIPYYKPHALRSLVDEFERRLPTLKLERDIEGLVYEILRASNVDAVAQPQFEGKRPDFAMWSDALASYVGNPLIVEVKRSLAGPRSAQIFERVQGYVEASGALWGLLIYVEGPNPETIDRRSAPRVLAVQLSELLERLKEHSFVDVVRMLRNERFHGTGR